MSRLNAREPACTACEGAVELLIEGRSKDLGGFSVRRVLPSPMRRTVGPFIFFDEMGPADFPPGEGINVRPHPHIGLSTVTFLFDGSMLHRDSLGFVQEIQPGAVNLMTAGRGIVHSERTPEPLEREGQYLHGIQTWMALPEDRQEIDPAFVHYPKEVLPVVIGDGVVTTLIIGSALGECSPVFAHSDTLYLEQRLEPGATAALPEEAAERAIYAVDGEINVHDQVISAGTMAVLGPGAVILEARRPSRVMIVGGESVGRRHIWWNFVHSSRQRIERAKHDWADGAFDAIPGDDEFIPLPES
jgi:redox-sensitive bicupin YhaK (pirin superfamily)